MINLIFKSTRCAQLWSFDSSVRNILLIFDAKTPFCNKIEGEHLYVGRHLTESPFHTPMTFPVKAVERLLVPEIPYRLPKATRQTKMCAGHVVRGQLTLL